VPPLYRSVEAYITFSIPSVTMNEGILAFVTMKPTNNPSIGPTNSGAVSPSAITHQG